MSGRRTERVVVTARIQAARLHAKQRAERDRFVERVADLVAQGYGVEWIADDLDYDNIDSMLRRLQRAGRHDLSNRLYPRKRVA